MKSIFSEYKAGMENIYNSFFISFLALKPLMERPLQSDFKIPIDGFSFNIIAANQLNKLGSDVINEYVNSIRRHMLNDIVICYERYASLMYTSHCNNQNRFDPALLEDRTINASKFESLNANLFVSSELLFFQQLKRLRNSIVHFNGVYTKTNILNYSFHRNSYYSQGHEGEKISIELETIMYIYYKALEYVTNVNLRYFSQYPLCA